METIRAIVKARIPVMGHLGLTPQTATMLGGYKIQAKTAETAQNLLDDALALQEAGCFSIVIEAIPADVGAFVSAKLDIPTIGIGAGQKCDGQVLVFHDVLGIFDKFTPKFVKQYANLRQPIVDAFKAYASEVESGAFPAGEHSFAIEEDEFQKLKDRN